MNFLNEAVTVEKTSYNSSPYFRILWWKHIPLLVSHMLQLYHIKN